MIPESMASERVATNARQRHPAMVLAIIALVLVVLLTMGARNWILQTREDFGRRLQEVSAQVKVDKEQLSTSTARLEDINVRLAVIESRAKESAAQQQALESLYQSLLRSRDETALAEVEQLVGLAAQQIQLLGNVEGALIALQQADTRLGASERPGFGAVRKAIRRDIDRLKAAPKVDLVGLALQLDSVIRDLDKTPLISEQQDGASIQAINDKRRDQAVVPDNMTDAPGSLSELISNTWAVSKRLLNAAWLDVRSLISIREVSNPDALLLTPSQGYFVRENTRLRLLNARLALLSRQQLMLRNDLADARRWFVRYFDTQNPHVIDAIKTLDGLVSTQVATDLPNLADSLSALRLSRTPGAL